MGKCGKTPCTCKINNWQVFLKKYRLENKDKFKGKSGKELVIAASKAYQNKAK